MFASVIIPNWNGARLLPTCLDSLRSQTYRHFETIVVDNGSTDDSVQLITQHYPEVVLIKLPQNRFFSGAVNEGIRRSRGEIIAVLNNDTEVAPQWLAELCTALEGDPQARLCASKILLFDRRDTIHSAGDFYTCDGRPGNRGVWQKDDGRFDDQIYVFGACAGAAAYRRSLLEEIGLFDEDFGGYCEDVDLSFRAQLAGYRCRYVPTARVYHHLSASGGGEVASFYCGRNFINVIVKDMPPGLLRKYILRIVWTQLRLAGEALLHLCEPAARARLRGQLAALLQLPLMLHKRQEIQGRRKVSEEYIESILTPTS
ncbi:MAG: glycosyltransferase family 2 protein [Chloroflexi bacterium]|nr:glycosyltransferase family 2 protein [Chloroflexota bacterium]MCL5075072.1 glycosyltransferase family 2 protein [Chloroflexota bacterium]